jgi:hypothetical protein
MRSTDDRNETARRTSSKNAREQNRLLSRRAALTSISAGLAASQWRFGTALAATETTGPILATPAQIDAEKILLRLLKEPGLKQIQDRIRAKWLATPRGMMRDGAGRLDAAIAEWTNSLIFFELAQYRSNPNFLWCTEDTPRTWLGHTLGGVGTSGDNPDAVYRTANIDGGSRYEVRGKFDMARKPTQFTFEVDTGIATKMPKLEYSKNTDVISTVARIEDRDMTIEPDGSFRITIGGAAEGPNHLATAPGPLIIGVRDIIPDWDRQRPSRLSMRQISGPRVEPASYTDIRTHVFEDLEGFIDFWAAFPNVWFGGLTGNKIGEPKGRNGGWGFNDGLSFDFSAPDDALLVTLDQGEAAYAGFQINDPWMIAPDAKKFQVCLSSAQAVRNADGTRTYVISMTDPGVANWLDTAGLHQGLAIMRWQAIPKTMTMQGLVRDFRVIKHADLAAMPELARVTPQQRKAALAARAVGYANRAT